MRVRCARLSWDVETNERLTNGMGGNFRGRVTDINAPLYYGARDRYLADLGIAPARAKEFEEVLGDVASWSTGGVVTRDALYKRYVTADNSETWQGKYDRDKPFAVALKQLFDLNYAANESDAFSAYALTPLDSLPRTTLQELTIRLRKGGDEGKEIAPDDLITLVRQFKFSLLQGGLGLRSMGDLTLDDVLLIRSTDEWADYMQAVRGFLKDPVTSLTRGRLQKQMTTVYQKYARLAWVMTKYVTRNRATVAVEKWTPTATLLIDIGGALLTAAIVPSGAGLAAGFVYGLTANLLQDRVGMVARMTIKGAVALGAQADLGASLDFMRVKLHGASSLVEQKDGRYRVPLIEKLGFRFVPQLYERLFVQLEETINYPDGQLATGA